MRQIRAYCLGVVAVGGAVGNSAVARPGGRPSARDRRPASRPHHRRHPPCACPAGGWPRPPSMTSPARRVAAGPRSTALPRRQGRRAVGLGRGRGRRLLAELAVALEAPDQLEDLLVLTISRSCAPSATTRRSSTCSTTSRAWSCPTSRSTASTRCWPWLPRSARPSWRAILDPPPPRTPPNGRPVMLAHVFDPAFDLSDPTDATQLRRPFLLPDLCPRRPPYSRLEPPA